MARPYLDIKVENEKRLLEEIKAKKTLLTAFPPRSTFEISWRCNYRCKKCAYSQLDRGQDFSAIDFPEWDWDSIERLASEVFPTMRYTESTLLGEPFLSPQFERLMDLYRQYGVYYRPTTNGSLLTQDKIERLSGICDWLKCSFDAHNDELYQKLHLNSNFKTVVRNLKSFSRARDHMAPYPWFRIGIVLMRSNLYHLKDYADFVFQELGVDDIDLMALNYANEAMIDEFFWDIPEEANRLVDDFIDHCIKNKYRIRMAFARMPRPDGTWIDETSEERSLQIAASQPVADNSGYEKYSEEVRSGDIFGNKEQLEKGYFWSNDMRITRVKAFDGSDVGVCEFFTRPFFKPPTKEFDGHDWIKYESCGSCSTYVFGNLKEQSFTELYNSPMMQDVRAFLYNRYANEKEQWTYVCKNCLAVDQVYSMRSNGKFNVGVRFFPGDNLYSAPHQDVKRLIGRGWDSLKSKGLMETARLTFRFLKDVRNSAN